MLGVEAGGGQGRQMEPRLICVKDQWQHSTLLARAFWAPRPLVFLGHRLRCAAGSAPPLPPRRLAASNYVPTPDLRSPWGKGGRRGVPPVWVTVSLANRFCPAPTPSNCFARARNCPPPQKKPLLRPLTNRSRSSHEPPSAQPTEQGRQRTTCAPLCLPMPPPSPRRTPGSTIQRTHSVFMTHTHSRTVSLVRRRVGQSFSVCRRKLAHGGPYKGVGACARGLHNGVGMHPICIALLSCREGGKLMEA